MSEWQSIETAPKDGTALLLYLPWKDRVCAGKWNKKLERWTAYYTTYASGGLYKNPSHWMPYPPPPQQLRD